MAQSELGESFVAVVAETDDPGGDHLICRFQMEHELLGTQQQTSRSVGPGPPVDVQAHGSERTVSLLIVQQRRENVGLADRRGGEQVGRVAVEASADRRWPTRARACSTAIWSASASASSWSWVTSTVVVAATARMRATSRRSSARSDASSELNGSSSSTTRWLNRQRPGERHALLLAAGELVGIAALEAGESDQLEQLARTRTARLGRARSRRFRSRSGAGTARRPGGRSRPRDAGDARSCARRRRPGRRSRSCRRRAARSRRSAAAASSCRCPTPRAPP